MTADILIDQKPDDRRDRRERQKTVSGGEDETSQKADCCDRAEYQRKASGDLGPRQAALLQPVAEEKLQRLPAQERPDYEKRDKRRRQRRSQDHAREQGLEQEAPGTVFDRQGHRFCRYFRAYRDRLSIYGHGSFV